MVWVGMGEITGNRRRSARGVAGTGTGRSRVRSVEGLTYMRGHVPIQIVYTRRGRTGWGITINDVMRVDRMLVMDPVNMNSSGRRLDMLMWSLVVRGEVVNRRSSTLHLVQRSHRLTESAGVEAEAEADDWVLGAGLLGRHLVVWSVCVQSLWKEIPWA